MSNEWEKMLNMTTKQTRTNTENKTHKLSKTNKT